MSHPFIPALAALCLALPSSAAAQSAPPPTVAADWCKLDAPGLYRDLREEARAAGRKEAPDCPVPAEPGTLPARLVVPLPCGRALSLARIDVASQNVLDHSVSRLGGSGDSQELYVRYTQGLHKDAVGGAYSLGPDMVPAAPDYTDLRARSYYIGEYELTALQHQLVSSGILDLWSGSERPGDAENAGVCAPLVEEAASQRYSTVLPQAGLSWFDAVDVVRALNRYVIAESQRRVADGSAPLVPWEQGSTGFFRLPSEAEWEFAARGGASADTELSQSQLYLVRLKASGGLEMGDISQIASFTDGSSRQKLSTVGARDPNLAGLYDTIGNVGEIVHDLFRLVRPDALHGARGGYTVRGGNSLTPPALLGIPHRQELAFYDAAGETASPFTGMRLMLTPPILTNGFGGNGSYRSDLQNTEFMAALDAAHARIVAPRQTPGADFRDEARSLLAEVRTADASVDDPAQLERLARIESALNQSEAAINEARAAELRATVRAATTAILNIHANSTLGISILQVILKQRGELDKLAGDDARKQRLSEQLRNMDIRLEETTSLMEFQTRYVLSLIRDLATADPVLVDMTIEQVRASMREQGLTLYERRAWPLFDQAIADMRAAPDRDHFGTYSELFDTRRKVRAELMAR